MAWRKLSHFFFCLILIGFHGVNSIGIDDNGDDIEEVDLQVISLTLSSSIEANNIVLVLGCSKNHHLIQTAWNKNQIQNFDDFFELLDNGNIVTKSSLQRASDSSFSFYVESVIPCFVNVPPRRLFVLDIVSEPSLSHFSQSLYSGHLFRDMCTVCRVLGMEDITVHSKDTYESQNVLQPLKFDLIGKFSDSFTVVTSSADNSAYLLRNGDLPEERDSILGFILEACVEENKCGYTNVVIKLSFGTPEERDDLLYFGIEHITHEDQGVSGDETKGPEFSAKNDQRSVQRLRRQSSSTLEKMTVDVPEDITGVLFSLDSTQTDGWGQFTYRIVLATPENIFTVDQNGNVSLLAGNHLDYDFGARQYHIHIDLISTGGGVKVKQIQVTMNVQDVNDEGPVFTNRPTPYLATVQTTDPVGTVVYRMTAQDPDADYNNSRHLEYTAAPALGFQIQPLTGEIRTSRMFNQPSDPGALFALNVTVMDTVFPGNQMTTANVYIKVGDRPPQFMADLYKVSVTENNIVGERFESYDRSNTLTPLTAINFQERLGGSTIYTVYESNNTTSELFRVDDGQLVALKVFSYNTDDLEYNLTLRAQDNSTGMSTDVQLMVDLLKNFNPRFHLPVYTATVSEGIPLNQTFLTVSAYQGVPDSSTAGVIFNYTLIDSPVSRLFSVYSVNGVGEIRTKGLLDYDTTYPYHSYSFEVAVKDQNDRPSPNVTTLVVVYVKNENDFAPEFIHQSVSTIPDNLDVRSTVMNVRAIDKDGDKIKYSFRDGQTRSEFFNIDENTGRITLAAPIPEGGPNTFILPIYAVDDGSCCDTRGTVHTSQQNVTISIVDSVNRKPVFTRCTQYYSTAVMENQDVGTPVVQVSATDSNRGENGDITYSILSFRGPDRQEDFKIDPVTGNITTASMFDRENINTIVKVTVIAEDKGKPPLRDECTFPIKILDENDNAPMFLTPSSTVGCSLDGHVVKNATVGTVVFNVGANDDDDIGNNSEIEYRLSSNPGNLFAIDPDSGVVRLNSSLTDQNEGTVQIVVMARDRGTPSLNSTTNVNIKIMDAQKSNELPPFWVDNNPDVYIDDSTRERDVITFLNISSTNISAVGIIHDCEAQAQEWDFFRLIEENRDKQSIRLVAAKGMKYAKRSQRIQLRASKTIGQQGSIRDVASDMYPRIILIDTNDRIPNFENRLDAVSQMIEFSVTENQTAPVPIGTLFAFDADLTDPFNKVTYRLDPPVDGFAINNITGEITTTKVFDKETGQDRYVLSVRAIDGAPSSDPNMNGGPNTGSVAVRITIEDVNDNPPYFTQSTYSFSVSEDQAVNDVVGNITAQDRDDDLTSQYTKYSISSNDPGLSSLFSVRETTGEIIVANVLSGRSNQDVQLTFTADDGKWKASVPVSITITKAYERRPEFTGDYNIKNIVANRSYDGETVFQVKATDPDCQSSSCGIRYSLLSNDPSTLALFHIDSVSGNVTLTGLLEDRQYSFSVQATKQTTRTKRNVIQPQSSYAAVYINPALCNQHQCPTAAGVCECCDYCMSSPCENVDATCSNICTPGHPYGYVCNCPSGYTGRLCETELPHVTAAPVSGTDGDNTWLIILLVCLAVVIVAVILVIAFLLMRRRNTKDKESMIGYDNEDYDIREDVMDYDEDGAGDEDYDGYDISVISKPAHPSHSDMARPDKPIVAKEAMQQGSVPQTHLRGFITDRLSEAEEDPRAPPYDTLREFAYEGSGSDAGSLSSIETTTSGGSQDYDYLNEWGPKFARLADMYNTYEDSD